MCVRAHAQATVFFGQNLIKRSPVAVFGSVVELTVILTFKHCSMIAYLRNCLHWSRKSFEMAQATNGSWQKVTKMYAIVGYNFFGRTFKKKLLTNVFFILILVGYNSLEGCEKYSAKYFVFTIMCHTVIDILTRRTAIFPLFPSQTVAALFSRKILRRDELDE